MKAYNRATRLTGLSPPQSTYSEGLESEGSGGRAPNAEHLQRGLGERRQRRQQPAA